MFTPASSDNEKIKWSGSQADFISFVEFFEAIGGFKVKDRKATADEIGKLFLKVIDLDLSPFSDFHSMRMSVSGSQEPGHIAKKLLDHMEKEDQLSNALEGTGIEPSDETQARQMLSWMATNDFVNKLSKHIDLPDK